LHCIDSMTLDLGVASWAIVSSASVQDRRPPYPEDWSEALLGPERSTNLWYLSNIKLSLLFKEPNSI